MLKRSGFSQSFSCPTCKQVIVRVIGNGYYKNGWLPCQYCRIDVQIVNARVSGVRRPTELLNPDLPSRNRDNLESSQYNSVSESPAVVR